MEDQVQGHRPGTRSRRTPLRFAIAYYVLVGLIAAAVAALFVISTLELLLAGLCGPAVDVPCSSVSIPTIAFVVGVVLLSTAWRIRRDPPQFGRLVNLGAVVGVAVPALPILFILAMSDSLRIDIVGSPDLGPVLLLTGLLLWAVHSAIVVWRGAWGFERHSIGSRPIGDNSLRVAAIALTLAAFLAIGVAGGRGFSPSSLPEYLLWFLAPAVLAVLSGARRDPIMASLTYLSAIFGAVAVAWAAGPVGVLPGADPAMRSSYYGTLVIIAAGVSAVIGCFVVAGGYWLGRRLAERRHSGTGDRPRGGAGEFVAHADEKP